MPAKLNFTVNKDARVHQCPYDAERFALQTKDVEPGHLVYVQNPTAALYVVIDTDNLASGAGYHFLQDLPDLELGQNPTVQELLDALVPDQTGKEEYVLTSISGEAVWRIVNTTGVAANQTEADAGTDTTKYISPATLHGNVSRQFAARPARQGVISDGTGAVSTTPDNDVFDTGTGDKGGFVWLFADDVTPGASEPVVTKFASNLGFKVYWLTTGVLRLQIGNGSNFTTYQYDTTTALPAAAGEWGLLEWSEDADGNFVVWWNGVAVGDPVDMSGASAQTRDNTGSLLWGSDASNYWTGGMGERGIVDSVITAAQATAIHVRGTAVGSGLTQLQHLFDGRVPYCAEDISGNAVHSIYPSALGDDSSSALYPVHPLSEPEPDYRPALRSNGAAGTKAVATLNDQDPGDGDFVLWWRGIAPFGDATATTKTLAALTQSTTEVHAVEAVQLGYYTGNLVLFKFGTNTSYVRRLDSAALFSHIAALGVRGVEVYVAVVRSSSGIDIYLRTPGAPTLNVTSLFLEATGGASPPAWTDRVAGTHLIPFYRNTTYSSAYDLHDLGLTNFAPTAAQIERHARTGSWGLGYDNGDNSFGIPTGEAATPGASDGTTVGFSGTQATISAESGARTGGAGSYILRATKAGGTTFAAFRTKASVGSFNLAGKYRVKFWGRASTTGTVSASFNNGTGGPGSGPAYTAFSFTADWQEFEGEITFPTDSEGDYFIFVGPNWSVADWFEIDDLELVPIGTTARLRADGGIGGQAENERFANGSSNFDLTGGYSWVVPKKRGQVKATLTWAASHEAKQVTSSVSVPAGALVESITLQPTASTSGSGATVGTVNDPNQFVAATALTSGTVYSTLTGGGLTLLEPGAGGTANNDLTFVVDPDTANFTGSITVTINYILP